MPVHPVAAAGFGAAAEVYERARPSYPTEAVDWIAQRAALAPGATVVDVGAGTGKLTRLLVPTGARVIAVEPLAEMRAKLEQVVPGIEPLAGTAEEMPLPDGSADAVVVAQAFHWFDADRALPELHRVLREDGILALIWNSRDPDDPLQRELEDLLRPLRETAIEQQLGAWREPFRASPLFGPVEEAQFRHEQRLTADGLCARVASTSFVAVLPPAERDALLAQVRSLAYGLEESFAFPYVTEIYVTRRLTSPAP
jgi:SAM-dependent methyltransferase